MPLELFIFVHFFWICGLKLFGKFLNNKLNSKGYIWINLSGEISSLSDKLCLKDSSPEKFSEWKIGNYLALSFSINVYVLFLKALFEGLLLDILNFKWLANLSPILL